MPEIDAKVAKLLDEYSVALNAGEDKGVPRGATATLWRFVDVKDPDTGEVLGRVAIDALRLQVDSVHPRFCVARVAGNTSFLVTFGLPRKRIQAAAGDEDLNAVRVRVGDLVTIVVPDVDESLGGE